VTCIVNREQKQYYMFGFRELHNEFCNNFPGGRKDDGTPLLSDTTLRLIKPRWLCPLTDSQKQMCGCDICIIKKDLVTSLFKWQTKRLEDLRHEAATATNNTTKRSLSTTANLFEANGYHRYSHPREVVESMTCPFAWNTELHRFSCVAGRCANCPGLVVPNVEKDINEDTRKIHYEVFEPHSFCSIHKSLTNAPTKCSLCEAAKLEDETFVKGKFTRKQRTRRAMESIGTFMETVFPKHLQDYRHHQWLVTLLGKHHSVHERQEKFRLLKAGSVTIQRDYADALVSEITDESTSTHFGENAKLSMEGITMRFVDANDAEHMLYYVFLSDDNRQDSRTSYINTSRMIDDLRESYGLLPRGSTLLELMDGCSRQCRCSTALWTLTALSYKHQIIIDRMISAPHHGKGDCDSQSGVDKNYMRMFFRRRKIAEDAEDHFAGIMASQIDENGKKLSFAELAHVILSHPSRTSGLKSESKHAKREAEAKIETRKCFVMHHGNTDTAANFPMPLLQTDFRVKTGFTKKKGERYNGIAAHYNFQADYRMGVGRIAVRRIPCCCNGCFQKNQLLWLDTNPVETQPRFQPVVDCEKTGVFEGCNDWKIVHLDIARCDNEQEIEDMFNEILSGVEECNLKDMRDGQFGAFSDVAGFHLVRWKGTPFVLSANSNAIEGMGGNVLNAGEMACKGEYWNKLAGATRWYTPAPRRQNKILVFRIRYVVHPDVQTEEPSDAVKLPGAWGRTRQQQILKMNPRRMTETSHQAIQAEIARRDLLDFEERDSIESDDNSSDASSVEDTDDEEEGAEVHSDDDDSH